MVVLSQERLWDSLSREVWISYCNHEMEALEGAVVSYCTMPRGGVYDVKPVPHKCVGACGGVRRREAKARWPVTLHLQKVGFRES